MRSSAADSSNAVQGSLLMYSDGTVGPSDIPVMTSRTGLGAYVIRFPTLRSIISAEGSPTGVQLVALVVSAPSTAPNVLNVNSYNTGGSAADAAINITVRGRPKT